MVRLLQSVNQTVVAKQRVKQMMYWEKKVPDRNGLWANSYNGKTLGMVHTFKEGAWYNSDYYWCRIGDVPEVLPKMKKLSLEDLMECIKNQKEIMISDVEHDIFYFKQPLPIEALGIFKDGSYRVFVKNNINRSFNNTEYNFYADL